MSTQNHSFKSRFIRRFVVNFLYISLLSQPVLLLAHDKVLGAGTNNNKALGEFGWTLITSVKFSIPVDDQGFHNCAVTASADVDFSGPTNIENKYIFVLSRNGFPPSNSISERTVELADSLGVDDPDSKPVSTTLTFSSLKWDNGLNSQGTGPGGNHEFRFYAKALPGSSATEVLDASMSVVCMD